MDVREKSLNEKRLIDANRALEIVHDQRIAHPNAYHLTTYATLILREAPTVDAVEVVHGRWIEPSRLYYGAKQYECSLCYSDTFWKKHSITEKYPHCPNCGCRMDGERKGEANES